MRKSRLSEEQIALALRQAESGTAGGRDLPEAPDHRDHVEEGLVLRRRRPKRRRSAAVREEAAQPTRPNERWAMDSDAMGPDGPEGPGEPPAAPVYDLNVVTRYIEVEGSCDKDLFGDQVPGEFQYRIEVREGSRVLGTQQSSGYNTALGDMYQRNRTTNINFRNRTYRWSGISRSTKIEIRFRGAEWDGVRKDSRMANRGVDKTVPFKLGTTTRRIGLGPDPDQCALGLYYDATWTEIPAN